MYVLKWTNKYSGETGYVESISSKDRHFVNTFDKTAAKRYSSLNIAGRMITTLASYGEAENNVFEAEKV